MKRRHRSRAPDWRRLTYLSLLVLFQFLESFSYPESIARLDICRSPGGAACVNTLVQQSYQAGRGGGLLGGWFYSALVNNLTEIGGFVVMLMLMTFGALMLTRSSMAELAMVAIGVGRGLRANISQYAAQRRAARMESQRQMALASGKTHVQVSKPAAAQLTGAAQEAPPSLSPAATRCQSRSAYGPSLACAAEQLPTASLCR